MLRFVAHSHRVLKIALRYGWMPGARYTNLRDIRAFEKIGFIDIDWKEYSGGRPDIQRRLANLMPVVSVDCNRFTLDAAYGDYFDGEKFRPHPKGGYITCIRGSLRNINKLWTNYSWRSCSDAR